ncbi:ribonuclease domain-containing protein [Stratiformator vulcanicus]|uniref:Guanyl-specific ribonuclease Sa n=1 Tax=Stratiformator vulcanicus TaxID=2527980 RepID=A0A517R220_9PLAN|nr:ribonuclease domain-containing protein [Stratiformator vulcanicus]QDT37893.1 Guanyl-specific ribonuclease Sa [Stratiformator vulcanicus]
MIDPDSNPKQPHASAPPHRYRFGLKEWVALAVIACCFFAYDQLTAPQDDAKQEIEQTADDLEAEAVEPTTNRAAESPKADASAEIESSELSGKVKAFVSSSETLVEYQIERGRRVCVVAAKEQIVVRSDGGGLTLAGQTQPDQVVRLDCDHNGTIIGRPADATIVRKIVVPKGTVRVLGTANDKKAVLLLLGDSRVVRGPPIRGVPLPGKLGTLAFDRIRPGMLIAERAAGDVAENCFPNLLVPPDTIENAVVKDFGRTVYTGPIDVSETYQRLALRKRFPHNNDGSVFQNRERRLPRQRPGYYREYVHPTEGKRGPGPQRLVIGRAGDIWYTGDHYESFEAVLEP